MLLKTEGSVYRQTMAVLVALAILVLNLSFCPLQAQDNPPGKPYDTTSAPAGGMNPSPDESAANKGFRLGIHVDLVLMYISAFDKTGSFVPGLKQNQFKVYEDGVEQEILSFAQEDVPISMGILVDLSSTMNGEKTEKSHKAALEFIQASNPEDEVFLIGFDNEVELLQDFTSDIDEIKDALDNTIIAGQTLLYDAIFLGVEKAHKGKNAKKAVVVITDGEDNGSFYKLDQLISLVQEKDVQVFCIGIFKESPAVKKSASKKAYEALARIAEETGGKVFFPKMIDEIHAIVAEIARELRSQYSIGYSSTNQARDGSFRRVKIKLAGDSASGVQIRHRRGYFAPKTDAPQSPESGTSKQKK